jgi:hypothetical protein
VKAIIDVVRSYILVHRDGDIVNYVSYGQPAVITPDLKNARRYARVASAKSALHRINPRPGFPKDKLKVEVIDE